MATVLQIDVADLAAEAAQTPFDAVIVGAGSAGLTAAVTLASAGKRVALLEAGPAPFLTHVSNTELRYSPQFARNLRNAVQYAPELASGGKFGSNFGCFGGRGLFWNGAAPRFSAADLSSCPISAADLEPHYKWAEAQFRVSDALGRTPLAQSIITKLIGVGIAAEPGPFAVDTSGAGAGRLGAGIASGIGLFLRAGDATLERIRIATGALVQRIFLSNGAARGVAVATGAGVAEIWSRSVVLAGGCIESIKLAALSGVADPHQRIGKGLQEHLFYHCAFAGAGVYASAPDAAVVYAPAASQSDHQWEIHAPGDRLFSLDDGSAWTPNDTAPYRVMARSFAATEKRDDNHVEARDGGLGSSVITFTHSPADEVIKQKILTDAVRLAGALGLTATDAIGVSGAGRFRAPGSSYHEAGGLDMGVDPQSSVTDANGCFHATAGLVCVDAAVFPRIGATNPHLTIVAMARRNALALAARLI